MKPISIALAVSLSPFGAGAQAEWPRGDAEQAGLSTAKLQALEAAVRAGEFKRIGSVAVARHGKLVYEAYFKGDASTLRNTRSATKSITSLLIGLAIADKKLSGIDARVLALLPQHQGKLQNKDPRKERITVEQLLTMSSPLDCNDWDDDSPGNEEKMYPVKDWGQFILDVPIRERPPERAFSYCTGGVFLLGEIIKSATGVPADRYAAQRLFAPLGITQAQWPYSPLGIPMTGGGLELATRDLLKIAQVYLDKGQWQGKRIIDEAWVRASTSPHARIDADTEYGFLWWLKSFGAGDQKAPAFFMTGNGGNKVVAIPSLEMTVAITSTNYNTKGMHQQTEKLLVDYILSAVSTK